MINNIWVAYDYLNKILIHINDELLYLYFILLVSLKL